MENATENQSHIKVSYDLRTLYAVSGTNRVTRLLIEDGCSEEPRRITVKPTYDAAYELKGHVHSSLEKHMVMSFVKTNHPFRDIIDHITVAPINHPQAA